MAGTKRVIIPVRVLEDVAQAIDKARGEQSRSAWVAAAIEAALGNVSAESRAENKRIRESAACPPHPRGRVVKGFCYRCGRPAS